MNPGIYNTKAVTRLFFSAVLSKSITKNDVVKVKTPPTQ